MMSKEAWSSNHLTLTGRIIILKEKTKGLYKTSAFLLIYAHLENLCGISFIAQRNELYHSMSFFPPHFSKTLSSKMTWKF